MYEVELYFGLSVLTRDHILESVLTVFEYVTATSSDTATVTASATDND